ncbi:XRE family transcriptional regulator [Paenibacillus mucilaginosus 3016]|uniref:XRE family transcriptional regulator n=1 Tax=Paenibacillus mucilaginosus 3016 TaxID=1116391 RepID=H6NCN5_9BACL|nr:XRE family transcriptional regulator [Paenibacillus mucilaginosus]AFC28964.1 XRE family transcriptional regulator [Paenibacillus mucilaginosus 3016]WFA17712.1 XRE family transcriptional regulator [Paenibacillus mucilaginosus]
MNLGDKIKKLRKEQNRSLDEIASICNFSKSLLSKIENGKTVPPISTLLKIADALGTKISILLDDEQQSGTVFTPKEASDSRMVKTEKGYSFFTFAVERSDKLMQPFLFVIRKEDQDSQNVYSHVGEEFIYILEGEMRYKVGNVEYTMRPGDSLYFDSIEKHTLIPLTEEVKYIGIFTQFPASPVPRKS